MYEDARKIVAKSLKAGNTQEVIFTKGATEGLNLIAAGLGETHVGQNDEILISTAEHHSNLVPWQQLAQRTGAHLRFLHLDSMKGGWKLADLEPLLSDRTKVVALQHTSNVIGTKQDLYATPCRVGGLRAVNRIIKNLAPHAFFVLDACQAFAHERVDSNDADFIVGSAHKLFGPTGIGFVCSKHLGLLTPQQFGGEMIENVRLARSKFRKGGQGGLEAGTPPIGEAIAMGVAFEFLESNYELIKKRETELTRHLLETVKKHLPDFTLLGPADPELRCPLVSLHHPKIHASDLATFLDFEGIELRAGHHCCQPLHKEVLGISGSLRASLCFYNTHDEIDRFVRALRKTSETLLKMVG